MKRSIKQTAGFTLIEMIVSLGVFSVVVTITVGAILVLVSTNQRLQAEQSVMTNLSFALDTMTREIRTGTNYYCVSSEYLTNIFYDANNHETIAGLGNQDCTSGPYEGGVFRRYHGISVIESGDSLTGDVSGARRIFYFYDLDTQMIMRRVGNDPAQPIISSGIAITKMEIYVNGSDTFSGATNPQQPTVSIFIEAKEKDDPSAKAYQIQTTITQRVLDL